MSSTQEMVTTTINIASTSTTSIKRISPSLYMMHGEKLKKLNGLNFKR
jgi:hypothetical protein